MATNTTIPTSMSIDALAKHPLLSACSVGQLKTVQKCLLLVSAETDLSAFPEDTILKARAMSQEQHFDANAGLARLGLRFVHWHRRTGTWVSGAATPPSPDGRRAGWVLFETRASSDDQAKIMAERYVNSKQPSYKGGMVTLIGVGLAVVDGQEIKF